MALLNTKDRDIDLGDGWIESNCNISHFSKPCLGKMSKNFVAGTFWGLVCFK